MYQESTVVLQSPDGQKMMIIDKHANGRVGVDLKIEDKPARRLLDFPVDAPPAVGQWLPDSKRIVYSRDGVMWIVSIDTGEKKLYPWNRSDAVAFTDLSRNGREALFVRERMNGKLILIDNFH
jgi:hypothetical protein